MSLPLWIDEVSKLLPAITGSIGIVVGGTTLLKSLLWKRAELASGYLKELNTNSELVFACRCLDWQAGALVVPDSLAPLLRDGRKTIDHDKALVCISMRLHLTIEETERDPRLIIYRTCLDALLSWMNVLANSMRKKLFAADDLREVGFWVERLNNDADLRPFIDAFRYGDNLLYLASKFNVSRAPSNARHEAAEELSIIEQILAAHPVERAPVHRVDPHEVGKTGSVRVREQDF